MPGDTSAAALTVVAERAVDNGIGDRRIETRLTRRDRGTGDQHKGQQSCEEQAGQQHPAGTHTDARTARTGQEFGIGQRELSGQNHR